MTWFPPSRRRALEPLAAQPGVAEDHRGQGASTVAAQRYAARRSYLPHVNYLQTQPDGASPFDRPTFVYLGTFTPIWDHDLIFEAVRSCAYAGQTPSICMIGSGADRPRWEAFVRQHSLDNVRLAGFLDEPEPLASSATRPCAAVPDAGHAAEPLAVLEQVVRLRAERGDR